MFEPVESSPRWRTNDSNGRGNTVEQGGVDRRTWPECPRLTSQDRHRPTFLDELTYHAEGPHGADRRVRRKGERDNQRMRTGNHYRSSPCRGTGLKAKRSISSANARSSSRSRT